MADEIETKVKNFRNGDRYEGGWRGGLPEATGKYVWTDGSTYEGEWRQGNKHGQGTYVWPSRAEYSGEWVNGCMHGYGTFKASDGSVYTGGWAKDLKHGLGKKQYANGDKYDGIWKNGKPDGPGRYVWQDGNVYNGEWKLGRMHGQGTFQWKTGERYDGEWKEGHEDNLGTFQWKDNATYDGLWQAGKKHGIGIFRPAPPENRRATAPVTSPTQGGTSEGSSSHMESLGDEVPDGPLIAPSVGKNSSGGQPLATESGVSTTESVFLREYRDGNLVHEHALNVEDKGDLELLYALFRREEPGKIKRLLKGDKEKGPGEVIYKGHSSYDLMLNLQLGIQYSVGKINMVRVSDNMAVEEKHFAEKLKLHFPRRGGNHTPPHPSQDFKWKDYAPMVFRRLREAFGIDPADYLISLCGNHALRELASPGKSGSIFYISHDDRFIIKTMKKGEMKHLFSMLKKYYEHMAGSPHTLITKYYGLHRVTPYKGNKIRFMVMNNLFRTELPIHRKYDLKGSTQGRFTRRPKGEPDVDPHTTLKDLDLEGLSFKLEEGWHERLHEMLEKDCQLLKAMNVMDYSLLLGVHSRSKGQQMIPDTKEDDAEADMKKQQSNFRKQISRLKLEERQAQELLNLVEKKLESRKTMRNSSRQLLTRQPKRNNTMRPKAYGEGGTDALAYDFGYDRVQLGKNMAATAITVQGNERTADNVVLYFGIIDILQAYNVQKKLEHGFKSIVHDGKSISAIDPAKYAHRFQRFMRKKVFL
ncbi:hypothetical protein BSKO_06925 [Bryopsis sp. KO-2023]|nr:hypothetical protein BSKO_06925 [Bryopsis sp. KO-2023]